MIRFAFVVLFFAMLFEGAANSAAPFNPFFRLPIEPFASSQPVDGNFMATGTNEFYGFGPCAANNLHCDGPFLSNHIYYAGVSDLGCKMLSGITDHYTGDSTKWSTCQTASLVYAEADQCGDIVPYPPGVGFEECAGNIYGCCQHTIFGIPLRGVCSAATGPGFFQC